MSPGSPGKFIILSALLLALAGETAAMAATLPFTMRSALRSRFGDGSESAMLGGLVRNDKNYFENRLDLDGSHGRFDGGLTLESREKAEFSEDFTRLRKGWIQYTGETVQFRAGTLYGLMGRGLTLDLHEDRVIEYDNTVHGFQGSVELGALRVKTLAGRGGYMDYRSPRVVDDHTMFGAGLDYEFSPGATAGISALHDRLTSRRDRYSAVPAEVDADIPVIVGGPHLELISGAWESFFEVSWKHTGYNRKLPPGELYQGPIRLLDLRHSVDGAGAYGAVSYAGDRFGAVLEYKNYQYNLETVHTMAHHAGTDPSGISVFQYPPTVYKEHHYALLNRYPVDSNPDNEIGLQMEVTARASGSLDFQLVAGMTSRADLLFYPEDGLHWRRERGGFPLLPCLGKRYSPRWDTFGELTWRPSGDFNLRGGYGYRRIVDYRLAGNYGSRQMIHTLPLKAEALLGSRLSLLLDIEAQRVHDKNFPYRRDHDTWWNEYAALGIGWARTVNLTLGSEFSGKSTMPGESDRWPFAALSVRLMRGGTLNLFYGSQREGMMCSNGLCKYQPGFKGFRAEMNLFY